LKELQPEKEEHIPKLKNGGISFGMSPTCRWQLYTVQGM
jgi:hypothetical protein